jgi:osmotically-inducible protein OsmY
MPNRGKQLGLLAGLGVGASLFLTDAGRDARKRARTKLARIPDTNHALAALVCAELDNKVEHGKGIQVFAEDNRVTLRGDALRDELDSVMDAVRSVSSVRGVDNLLEIRDTPGNVLALQN